MLIISTHFRSAVFALTFMLLILFFAPQLHAAPIISDVTITGPASNPTFTVNGTGFGSQPAVSEKPNSYNGFDFGDQFYFNDFTNTQGFQAGHSGNAIGLLINSYSDSTVVFQFSDIYPNLSYPNSAQVLDGDPYAIVIKGDGVHANVTYSQTQFFDAAGNPITVPEPTTFATLALIFPFLMRHQRSSNIRCNN